MNLTNEQSAYYMSFTDKKKTKKAETSTNFSSFFFFE